MPGMHIRRSACRSFLPIVLAIHATTVFAQDRPACAREMAYAMTDAGTFIYIEDTPSSPNTEGRLELVRNGQTLWSIATARGCSNGISICNLAMNYTVADGTVGSRDFDMSFGTVETDSGEVVCVTVMSQMGESLGYLQKRYWDQTVTFALGRSDAPALQMRDFLRSVPSVFQHCGCGGDQTS